MHQLSSDLYKQLFNYLHHTEEVKLPRKHLKQYHNVIKVLYKHFCASLQSRECQLFLTRKRSTWKMAFKFKLNNKRCFSIFHVLKALNYTTEHLISSSSMHQVIFPMFLVMFCKLATDIYMHAPVMIIDVSQ